MMLDEEKSKAKELEAMTRDMNTKIVKIKGFRLIPG